MNHHVNSTESDFTYKTNNHTDTHTIILEKQYIQSIFTTGFKPTHYFFTQLEGSLIKTEVDWKALAFSNKCSVLDKEITSLSKWMMRYLHFSACKQLYISRSLLLSISSWSETAANYCSWSCCIQGSYTGLFGICLCHYIIDYDAHINLKR